MLHPTFRPGRLLLAATFSLLAASACQRADVQPSTLTLLGEWQLTISGGGFTGAYAPPPAGHQFLLRFNADNTYAQLDNGQLREAGTYSLRRLAWSSRDTATTLTLEFLPTQPANSFSTRYRVSTLTASDLSFDSNGGCAVGFSYVRTTGAGSGTR